MNLASDLEVEQIRFDFRVELRFSGDRELTIEGPFRTGHGVVEPADPADSLVHIHSRLGMPVRLSSDDRGTIILEFDDDQTWQVPPHEAIEAWEYRDVSTGLRVLCSPGGEEIVWSPER